MNVYGETQLPSASGEQPFDEFAKVELFGHQVLVARVSKAPVGDFIRCDVIGAQGETVYTKLVNPKAIYAINLVSKDVALALAKARSAEPPVSRYELPTPALPPAATEPGGTADEDEDKLPEGWNGDGR